MKSHFHSFMNEAHFVYKSKQQRIIYAYTNCVDCVRTGNGVCVSVCV